MSENALPKGYEPHAVEDHWREYWEKNKTFTPDPDGPGEPFSIVIPPPNVTGALHIGHALNHTLIDVLCRHARQKGKKVLWLPGTDHAGIATQIKVEEELRELFPEAGILRMDADTTAGGHEEILQTFERERVPILLGTQMVAKGLDFENVTLVGVLSADISLYVDNYRAAERTFSLLTQVVGRAGRGEKEGRAVIQTYTPEKYGQPSGFPAQCDKLSQEDLAGGSIGILDLMMKCKLAPSKKEARRLVEQGGVEVDGEKVTDVAASYTADQMAGDGLMLKKGKKVFHRVKM